MAKTIKITQTRSAIGRLPKHKATLLGLGLRRIGHTVERDQLFLQFASLFFDVSHLTP
ncbi:50S ribosomal protein L30, partial [Salmonella enterica subsp. enterica serovar Enteritidis]|nr:50S ribosomal protein L30 [Salmonella enterica subsp. enterica serovar Enteritidis]